MGNGNLQGHQRRDRFMQQIKITDLKLKMKVQDIKAALPFEILADGEVIAEVHPPGSVKPTEKPKPYFFSLKR